LLASLPLAKKVFLSPLLMQIVLPASSARVTGTAEAVEDKANETTSVAIAVGRALLIQVSTKMVRPPDDKSEGRTTIAFV
jgi:hypothetical protein